jgi:signal transduction histidine kinase
VTTSTARRVAWSLFGLSVVAALAGSALAIANPIRPSVAATVVGYIAGLAFPTVGALIASRRPSSPIGWLLLVPGLALNLGGLAQEYAWYSVAGHHLPADGLVIALTYSFWAPALGALAPFTLLLFPDGHPPSPRWRWVLWAAGIGIALMVISGTLMPFGPNNTVFPRNPPNPLGILPEAVGGAIFQTGGILFLPTIPLSAIGLVLRLRRAHGLEREQTKWLAYGGAILALAVVIGLVLDGAGHEAARANLIGIAVMAIPISAGIAILRTRAFDIDVVIRKTVVAIVLAVLLTAIGFLAFAWIGQFALWGEDPFVRAAVGIGIGMLIVPLLRVSRRIANRLVHGRRATSYEVLTDFSDRLAGAYSTEDVLPRLATILRDATGATSATVWLRVGEVLRAEATSGGAQPTSEVPFTGDELPGTIGAFAVDVRHQGETLGALSVEMPANDPIDDAREKLVGDLAAQAGLVLRNVKLIEDLRASRQRLVAAQDEERRKIERNLHDGAQQQLVALSVKVRLARQLLDHDVDRAGAALDQLATEATDALENLRDLARGIYPPLLADKGLGEALVAQARKASIAIDVETDGAGRFPREIETAVYFCCLEALNNVAKYAEAASARVRLGVDGGELVFSVEDDGIGFSPEAAPRGSGLQGMVDRIDAVGGTLEIHSTAGRGTSIVGRVPIRTEAVTG